MGVLVENSLRLQRSNSVRLLFNLYAVRMLTMTLRYWDWTLDWMNLTRSSIWDSITGFGGDGNSSLPVTVGGGRCVTDGPFSNLQPIMYNHTYIRHCLSRGFGDGEHLGQLSGDYYSPEYIGGILREGAYSEFVKKVEYYLHNTMHTAIGGDFLALTAANGKSTFKVRIENCNC